MFQHKSGEKVSWKTYFDWFLLAFLAGSINVGGYMACHRFVSHVTGFATLAGISFKDRNFSEALAVLSIPGFFLLGVMVSAYLTEKKLASKVHNQKYAPVMGLVALCLTAVVVGGAFGWFGAFGEAANLKVDYLLLALLVGACGLQNAAISSASGATVRTTHLTGLTTDLGLGLIRSEVHKLTPEKRAAERRANLLRIGTILSFTFGSAIGAVLFAEYQYYGFILPTILALYAAFISSSHHA